MNRFEECRRQKGFTQKFVAITLGVKPPQISKWEKGTQSPSRENCVKLAELFGVSVDYLLGLSDDPAPLEVTVPVTPEARILVKGIDKMSEEDRKKALNIMMTVFDKYKDYFDERTGD